MSYTLTQAIEQVRFLLNESDAVFWSDTEIEDWIQQGVIQVSSKLLSAESEDTVTMVENQFKYDSTDESWLANLIKVKGMYYTTSNNLYGMQRIDIDMFGHTQHFQTGQRPRYYYENNRKLYVWPKPGADQAGDIITVLNSYVTDDITNLKDEHQDLTFLYAVSKAKSKDEKHQEAALYLSQFINRINFERQDKYSFGVEPTSSITIPQG